MPYAIENKLVIAVASSALFDLSDSHAVFLNEGPEAYRKYQEERLDQALPHGVAFPFIRRFLAINTRFPTRMPVEVVLLSRNSPETGLRVFRSIKHYGLDISRAAFTTGKPAYEYLPAFNASLFLSAHEDDVKGAIAAQYPAGLVLPSKIYDDEADTELRLAFDFDGVLADDEAETVFKQNGLDEFQAHETQHMAEPHKTGPLADLFTKLSYMLRLEEKLLQSDPAYQKILRSAIVTARGAPAHERVITTLKTWGVSPDETFFLGGMDKSRILSIFRPHMFFDDQLSHLQPSADNIPMVHVPFGISNRRTSDALTATRPNRPSPSPCAAWSAA
jgi:5'-nucleotidase